MRIQISRREGLPDTRLRALRFQERKLPSNIIPNNAWYLVTQLLGLRSSCAGRRKMF